MGLKYSRYHLDDAPAIFRRAFRGSIAFDAVDQVIDGSNMSSFVGAVRAWFGLTYPSRGDRLPGLAKAETDVNVNAV